MRDWHYSILTVVVLTSIVAAITWGAANDWPEAVWGIDTAPVVEARSVRCEAALGLRETTVEAGIRLKYPRPGLPPAGKLPQKEYDDLLRLAAKEIRQFC